MENEKQNTISVDTLISIIGKKEVQIELLNQALNRASEQLAQCQKEFESFKKKSTKT